MVTVSPPHSYVMRMKEFERERRLLQRQKRLRQREGAGDTPE